MGVRTIAAAIPHLARVYVRGLVLGALGCAMGATTARAQPSEANSQTAEIQPFRVVFSSSSVCENPNEFVEQLQRRSQHLRPAEALEPALTFFVSLTSTEAGVQGTLRVQNPDGSESTRQVPGADCHEVLSAMALIGALTVDPLAITGEELPPPPPLTPPPPSTRVTPPPEPVAEAPAVSWHLGVGGRVNGHSGVLPGFGLGGSVLVESSLPIAGVFQPGVRLAGHFAQASQGTGRPPPLGGTGEFRLLVARASLCPLLWSPSPAFGARPCALVDLGQLRAKGTDTVDPDTAHVFWAATGLELELELRLFGPLILGGEVGFLVPVVQEHTFFFVPRGENSQVHRTSSGFSGGLGLGLRFF